MMEIPTQKITDLENELIKYEGFSSTPYKDTMGYWTIGIGHKLDTKDYNEFRNKIITFQEALATLKEDLSEVMKQIKIKLPWIESIPLDKQDILLNMAFNIGVTGLMKFKNMLEAVKNKDYKKASLEMINSDWANQVKNRSMKMAKKMAE
jgi:lysozyme